MKRRPLEETLLALRRVRQAPGSEESQRARAAVEARPELKDALGRAFGRGAAGEGVRS